MNTASRLRVLPTIARTSAVLALAVFCACGGDVPSADTTTPPPAADVAAAAAQASQTLQATATTWTPEAMEDLLAPVALYPDPVLAQVFVASTNPQEVLDAGNWLIANPDLSGKALENAAEKAGFTVPMRAVMQFPEVVDKLCMNMPWTEELGQAYVNDQQGVMDAVQRLRHQAKDVGTLETSPQLKVETQQQEGKEIITVSPPKPEVVYVPRYDPVAAYAPPAAAPVAAPPPAATTSTTTTTTTSSGHSTESMVATGLLAFGAGLLVAEVFDDDDDYWHGGYYGGMYVRPMPYYPPYPYRPVYGGGFYPGHAYTRPPTYIRGGNTIVVNQNNNYYNRYNSPNQVARTRQQPSSPITAAKPNRPELQQLNSRTAQNPARTAPVSSEAWKGKGAYAGNDPQVRQQLDRQAAKAQTAQASRKPTAVQGNYAGATAKPRPTTNAGKLPAPKVQGGYAGAKPARDAAPGGNARPAVANREVQRPATPAALPTSATGVADRGRASVDRPTPAQASPPQFGGSAMAHGGTSGGAAREASSRGRQSMPSDGAAKVRAAGGRRR